MTSQTIPAPPFFAPSDTWYFLSKHGLQLFCMTPGSEYTRMPELVVFSREHALYGVRAHKVQALRSLGSYTPLPFTQPYILGLVNMAGQMVPVLDIAPLVTDSYTRPAAGALLIIVQLRGMEIGLLADHVRTAPPDLFHHHHPTSGDGTRSTSTKRIQQGRATTIAHQRRTHDLEGQHMRVHNETYEMLQAEVATLRHQVAELETQANGNHDQPDYTAFFTHALDMLCVSGFDGYFKHLTPQWSATLGYTDDELMAQPFIEFIHPDDRAATQSATEQLTATSTDTITFETRYRCKDGSYKYLRWSNRVVPEHECIYTTARDITEQRCAEAEVLRLNAELEQLVREQTRELRQNQALLQGILDHSPAVIYIKDPEGRYLLINHTYERLFHLKNEEVVGTTDFDIFPHEAAAQNRINDQAVAAARQAVESEELIPVDGEMRTYLSAKFPIINEQGEVYAIGGISTDITERKQMEDERRVFQELVENAPDGVCVVNPTTYRISYSNRAYRTMVDYGDEIIGMYGNALLVIDEAEFQVIGEQVDAQGYWQGMLPCRRQDGTIISTAQSVFAICDEHNRMQALGVIARDMTERQRQEEALRLIQFALDNASDIVEILDPTGRFVYVNNQACQQQGYTRDELLGMTLADLDPNLPIEAWPAVWEQVKQAGSLSMETSHRRKDGSTFPVEALGTYLQMQEQEFIVAFVRDVTERQRQEEALRTFKTVVENATEGIGIIASDGTFSYANATFCHMLQYTDLTGVRKIDIHDESPDTITSILQRTISEGHWQEELSYKRLDGSTFPAVLSAFAIRDEQGTAQAIGGIVRDLTEQKRYEENLQRMSAVIETSSDFIGIASSDGYPLYLNQAGQHLVGLNEEEYRQTQVIEYFTPEEQERIQRDVMPILMRDGRWKGECLFRHFKTGEIIEVEWNVFIIKNPTTGQPTALATVSRDLREQKRVEAERSRLQQQMIDAQRVALRELSSPLIPITDQVVIMPLIGTIDTQRAQQIMETLLDGIAHHHASVAILDITGVQVVDTQVANALIQAAQAVRLLGAQVILTGIGPAMAQTLVGLGIDLSEITTLATLQTGVNYVIRNH